MNTNLNIIDYVLPCEHTSHLFSNPLCKDQSLAKRIANVVFHIFTFMIPLGIYKLYTYFFPNTASCKDSADHNLQGLGTASVRIIDLSTLPTEEKKKIIVNLPLWFTGHFPAQTKEHLLKHTYSDWVFNVEGKSDKEIDEIFVKQQKLINDDFANPMSKTGITLRGLTIPKNDATLAFAVDQLVHAAWKSVLLTTRLFHYAECNTEIMTYDSRAVLVKELHKNAEQMTKLNRSFWIGEARNCTLFNSLKIDAWGPAFTISVRA